MLLRYILFHHQTTTAVSVYALFFRCVISSFITKPQLRHSRALCGFCCVISSFITKPQLTRGGNAHERSCVISSFITKPQHRSSSSRANWSCVISSFITKPQLSMNEQNGWSSCVISSFITKPQLAFEAAYQIACCVISSFITKPQQQVEGQDANNVALYPLSSPNHNTLTNPLFNEMLRYILFHHQTTTDAWSFQSGYSCVISSFITKPQLHLPC